MIYRFIVSNLLGITGLLLLCASFLSKKIIIIALGFNQNVEGFKQSFLSVFFLNRLFWLIPFLLMFIGSVLVIPSFIELVTTGATYEHWSRFIAMSALFSFSIILVVTRLLYYILDLIARQFDYIKSHNQQ
jgi:flagellar biosynthesis protein FlhB